MTGVVDDGASRRQREAREGSVERGSGACVRFASESDSPYQYILCSARHMIVRCLGLMPGVNRTVIQILFYCLQRWSPL